jgi:hypothetical protein
VHIPQSPFHLPEQFHGAAPGGPWEPRQKRARDVLDLLSAERPGRWQEIADDDTHVKTTLSAVGPDVAARLLLHAWLLTMANTHVILGWPLPERPLPTLEELRSLSDA